MSGPWYRSTWVRAGGVMMLLGVIGAAAIPFLIPVDRFRPLLVRLLHDSTGRDVQIGALRLYVVPTLHIHAADVRMKNPKGLPPGDAILVRSVDLGVAPRALLSRRLDVTHIALRGVRVNLLRDPSGLTNFAFSPPPPPAPPGMTAAPAGGASFLTLDRIGGVTVRNVEITVSSLDARRGQETPSFSLSGVNGTIRSIDPKAPAWGSRLEITAELRGARLVTPLLATPVRFPAGDVRFKGRAAQAAFSASLDGMRAEVSAAVAGVDPWSGTFTVAIPELDLTRLRTLIRSGAPGGGGAGSGPQALPQLRRLLASGEIKIDRLALPPLSATRMTSRLNVYTSAIQVVSYTLSAYGGSVRGAASLDSSVAGLPTVATANVSGVDLGQMVSTLSPSARRITGTLDAALKLSTALGRDPAEALTGTGTFAVRHGSFPGLDLKSTLAQMARALQLNVPAGPTRFSYFGGDLRISQQRVHSDSLRLEGEDIEGTAAGSAGFNKTLDYAGTGVLKTLTSGASPAGGALPSGGQILSGLLPGAAGATGVRVPFTLRGTLDDPKFSLAGTPQVIRGQNPQQPQPHPQGPSQLVPPDLLKVFQ